MEALKTRQYTVKNSPISESDKRFDRPIPWYALEALKPMGRMDGDGMPSRVFQTNEGTFTSANPDMAMEALNRECERLRGRVAQLESERQGWLDRCKANDATYDALNREHTKLKAECERLRDEIDNLKRQNAFLSDSVKQLKANPVAQARRDLADENEALLATIKCLVKLI